MDVTVMRDADALADEIARRMVDRLAQVQRAGRTPRVVLTGGTIAVEAYRRLQAGDVDWNDVEFWWGDERFVPVGDADRNDQQARDAFLDRLGVPAGHVHAMPADDGSLSARDAADAYVGVLTTGPFDLTLLGVGPDGHVASLFPGFPQLDEPERLVVEVFDSPKPPPVRITMTFPVLNSSRAVWFLVSGDGKREAVTRAFGAGTIVDTPAVGVTGLDETVWLLDRDAAPVRDV